MSQNKNHVLKHLATLKMTNTFGKTHAKKKKFLISTQNLNKTKLSKMKIKKLKEFCLEKNMTYLKKLKNKII